MSISMFLGPLLCTLCIGIIPVVTTRVNIALNGNANQSTTLYYSGFYWNASLATDSFKFGRENPDKNRCCSGTTRQTYPWWQVDLLAEHYIGKINVYGRTRHTSAQLRGFRLYIIPNGNFASLSDYLVHTDTITNATYFDQQANYTIYTRHRGRYVRIELPQDNGLLVVCEVEVFEECTDGYFGYNCSDKCGQCKHKHPCNKTNGQCIACAAGYRGATCLQECAEFKYGEECQLECGHCKDNIPCNHIDGRCDSCEAGFQLPRCKIACKNGWYGEDCKLKCGNCRGDAACNKSNGHCSSCAAGYTGIICQEECSNYTYGENCTGKCGHCRFGAACNYSTGLCSNCEDGYNISDKYCMTECADGKYGYSCRYKCGRCKNGSICNKTNGTCSHGCAAGYEEHNCSNECSGKTFGEDCKMKCHCYNDVACNTLTGYCPRGLCDFGWAGQNCNTGSYANACIEILQYISDDLNPRKIGVC